MKGNDRKTESSPGDIATGLFFEHLTAGTRLVERLADID